MSRIIYGTETWAMKAENLRSLERTEGEMSVRIVVEGLGLKILKTVSLILSITFGSHDPSE